MSIKQITVFVENKQGSLVSITDTLAKNEVNIRALSIAETEDFGVLRMIVNNEDVAEKTLADKQIDAVMNKIITNLENKVGAKLR